MLPQLVGPAARPGAAPVTEEEEGEEEAEIAEEGDEVEGAKKIVQHDSESEEDNEEECEQLSADGDAHEDEQT